jgi:integrase
MSGVVICHPPGGQANDTCPVATLNTGLELSKISTGPLFPKVNRGGAVERTRLSTDAVRQILLKRAARAGLRGTLAEPVSPHGLRDDRISMSRRHQVLIDIGQEGVAVHRSLDHHLVVILLP